MADLSPEELRLVAERLREVARSKEKLQERNLAREETTRKLRELGTRIAEDIKTDSLHLSHKR